MLWSGGSSVGSSPASVPLAQAVTPSVSAGLRAFIPNGALACIVARLRALSDKPQVTSPEESPDKSADQEPKEGSQDGAQGGENPESSTSESEGPQWPVAWRKGTPPTKLRYHRGGGHGFRGCPKRR